MTKERLLKYFSRIGCDVVTAPTLETLTLLQKHHAVTFPFENLNPTVRYPRSAGYSYPVSQIGNRQQRRLLL